MISFLKNKNSSHSVALITFTFLLVVLFIRIYFNYAIKIPLHFDEAQYWGWSQELKWGYFSKPPVLASLIKLSTSICGNSEFCIRLPSPILYFLSSIFIFYSAKLLSDNNGAYVATIIFCLMPGITFSSFIITTDVPLIFFSSLFIFIFLLIYKKKTPSSVYFIFLGLVFSLGFLSKYAMSYNLISIIILLFYSEEIRKKFLNYKLIIFAFTCLISILPHLIWNYNNGFVTINHTADNANLQRLNFNFKELSFFIMSQFIVFGAYPFFHLISNAVVTKKLNQEKVILYTFFLIPLIIVSSIALFSRANANWAVVGYPFGCILLALLLGKKDFFIKKIFSVLSQVILSLAIICVIIVGQNIIEVSPFAKQMHSEKLAMEIKKQLTAINNVAFMSDDREDYALMLFYMKDFDGKRAKWNGDIKINDHYELTTDVNNLKGHNLLFLTRTSPTEEMIKRSESSKLLKSLTFKERKKLKNYNLYLLKNWK